MTAPSGTILPTEEAGSPNVVGAVALHAAIDTLTEIGWPAIIAHDRHIGHLFRGGLASIPGVRVLGPGSSPTDTLPVVTFTVEGISHGLLAARLSAENGIGVRHGCFCAHPYMMRLLGLAEDEVVDFRDEMRRGDRTRMPGRCGQAPESTRPKLTSVAWSPQSPASRGVWKRRSPDVQDHIRHRFRRTANCGKRSTRIFAT